ncbi:MAG: acyltransferase family protein [Thermoleophilia bacterium]
MSVKDSSKDITYYLRGIAIIVVMVTHYVGSYDFEFYKHYFSNYGNALMSLFFILAGYGAFFSGQRRFADQAAPPRVILRYFMDRALRILPLYWVALVATAVLQPENFPVGEYSLGHIIAIALCAPLLTSPFWFVASIIQCYIFFPFLYLLFRRIGAMKYGLFNALLLVILLMISAKYGFLISKLQPLLPRLFHEPAELIFRRVILGNVFLFSIGMLLPSIVKKIEIRINQWLAIALAAFVLLETSFILTFDVKVLGRDDLFMEVLYYFIVYFFCWVMITTKPKLFLKKAIVLMGRNSYSLYLFHGLMFQLLIDAHLFQEPPLLSVMIILALFPLTLWFCAKSEMIAGSFGDRVLRTR